MSSFNKRGFSITLVDKSIEVYTKLQLFVFGFNCGSKVLEKLTLKLPNHECIVFRSGGSSYVGSDIDYYLEPDYYKPYSKVTITEDEFLKYIRFKNSKYSDATQRANLIDNIIKHYT